jgi:hypothetical protein
VMLLFNDDLLLVLFLSGVVTCAPADCILQWLHNSASVSLSLQGFIKFPRDTSKLGFGYASIAHEPAYPIKTSPNPEPAADGSVPLVPFRRAAQLTAAATSQQ